MPLPIQEYKVVYCQVDPKLNWVGIQLIKINQLHFWSDGGFIEANYFSKGVRFFGIKGS